MTVPRKCDKITRRLNREDVRDAVPRPAKNLRFLDFLFCLTCMQSGVYNIDRTREAKKGCREYVPCRGMGQSPNAAPSERSRYV